MSSTCAVCGHAPAAGAGLNRVGGADVCDRCYLGDAPGRIRERGWVFNIRQYEVIVNENDDRYHCTEASLVLPMATSVQLECRRRTGVWQLLSVFAPGLKSGDPLFDRRVRVKSKTPHAAITLLRDEGIQSILLDMLGEGSWITLHGGTIEVFSRRAEYVPEAKFSSEMCVLASHVARLHG